MRIRHFIFLFLAFVLVSATTQEKIIGTWELYKISKKYKSEKKVPKFQLIFNVDGTMVMKDFSENGKSKKGKYVYDESTKIIYVEDRPGRDARPMRIIKISSKKMILGPPKDGHHGHERLYLKKVG